jgi:hypothetical protein
VPSRSISASASGSMQALNKADAATISGAGATGDGSDTACRDQ